MNIFKSAFLLGSLKEQNFLYFYQPDKSKIALDNNNNPNHKIFIE